MTKLNDGERQEIVNISNAYYQEAYNSRLPIERVWDRLWALFNNSIDFTKKAAWQSKNFIPKTANAVRSASSFFKKALIRAKDFFVAEATVDDAKQYQVAVQKIIKSWLDENKFIALFTEAITGAALCNLMIFKVFWKVSEDNNNTSLPPRAGGSDIPKEPKKPTPITPEEQFLQSEIPLAGSAAPQVMQQLSRGTPGKLVINVVNPYKFFLDPTGRRKYCIHESEDDLADIKDIAKQAGYNQSVLDQIQTDYRDFTKESKEKAQQNLMNQPSYPSPRIQVQLREYWGTIYNTQGDCLYRNVTWTVANEKYLIRDPIPNPNLLGKWPFVWGPIIIKPWSVYHKSLLEDSVGLAMASNDLINMAMDTNAFAGLNAFEIDLDLIADPEEIKSGVYSGKVFTKRSGGTNMPLIRSVQLGQVSPQILRLYQEIDREHQNSTIQNEFLLGKPSNRGRATATEINVKTNQSGTQMEDIALDIEDNVFSPLLDLVYQTVFQYQTDFADPRLQQLDNDMKQKLQYLATMPNDQKKQFSDVFNFKCRGMSGVIAREAELQKIMTILGIVSKNQDLALWFKTENILPMIIEALNWDSKDTVRKPEEVVALKKQMAAAEQQQQQQGGGQPQGGGQ